MLKEEIIYLAICNQIQLYPQLLEEEDLDQENRGMAEYILNESLKVEKELGDKLQREKPIERPKW